MPKNIVVMCDGTGQEGGRWALLNTNIYKLYILLEDRTPRQMVYYDPGLGTGRRKITGNISGAGLSHNIQQAYRFIFDNFEQGDRIFLVGFSRGATTVRSLAGFIGRFGILPRSRPDLIKTAYKIYKTRAPLSKRRAKHRIEKYRVYDTEGPRLKRWAKRVTRRSAHQWNLTIPEELHAAMLHGTKHQIAMAKAKRAQALAAELRSDDDEAKREAADRLAEAADDRVEQIDTQLIAPMLQEADEFLAFQLRDGLKPKKFLRAFTLDKRAQEFIDANYRYVEPIEFLGCFDTVAALGLPFPAANAVINLIPGLRHKFHDLRLSSCVNYAYQALSIDDKRKVFKPEIWEQPDDRDNISQVWFSGVHTDVGGGYSDGGLADISLTWMLRKAHGHGLLLDPTLDFEEKSTVWEDHTDRLHDSRDRLSTRLLYRKKLRAPPEGTTPVIHRSVFDRGQAGFHRDWSERKPKHVAAQAYWHSILEDSSSEIAYTTEPWDRMTIDEMLSNQEELWQEWASWWAEASELWIDGHDEE